MVGLAKVEVAMTESRDSAIGEKWCGGWKWLTKL